ncbi:MAG: uroporphyrinogen-III C-methyltransferase [Clostridia bacterium]
MSNPGMVYLVGAGPGDAGLLSIKARQLLAEANVVVYDRLVGDDVMALIPSKTERINVGKNVGNHAVPQCRINEILLEQARMGKMVVRLKGGDCFLFGRGGEELELLVKNAVPFCVVPGVPSPIAASAYAGIPITHRDYCSSVHFITGHKKADGALNLDYEALVRLNGTMIFMMSVANAGEIADGLMQSGMDASMPCAIVENGTLPVQRKFIGTVGTLGLMIVEHAVVSPALIIVGKVCLLSDRYDWFSALPLKGRRILVTRPKPESDRLGMKLRALGADVTAASAIQTQPISFTMPSLQNYTWLVLTSAAGVSSFLDHLLAIGRDARSLSGIKIACVGTATAEALRQRGLVADFIPDTYSGKALAEALLSRGLVTANDRLLLARANIASAELTDALANGNIAYTELPVYETILAEKDSLHAAAYELVTFTSASCVEGFIHMTAPNTDFSVIRAVCIGEQTATAAKAHGMQVIQSKSATIDAMVDRILKWVQEEQL